MPDCTTEDMNDQQEMDSDCNFAESEACLEDAVGTDGHEVWDISEDDFEEDFHKNDRSDAIESTTNSMLKWILLYLFLWGTTYNVSANALQNLISFLGYVLHHISQYSPFLAVLATIFPISLYLARKYFDLEKDNFVKYVVCPSCHSIYLYDDCLVKETTREMVKKCSYVEFPRHPNKSFRRKCGHDLLKRVTLRNGKIKYYPFKVYCYKSVTESIVTLLKQQRMQDLCEHWRARVVPQNILADVYDGHIWKSFKDKDNDWFFRKQHTIGIILNCDWFPPFDKTPYSVGVLYAVILNLPRSVRFKPENMIIIGIIPGPDEPPLTILCCSTLCGM